MPARTKRRAKLDFHERKFVWWTDDDRYLRISSLDKKFVAAYPLGLIPENPSVLEVIGHEFPGLDPAGPRPIWLIVPKPKSDSMGGLVNELLRWSFDAAQERRQFDGPPHWC